MDRTLSKGSLQTTSRGTLELKWEDICFDEEEIRVTRSLVDQVEGPPKTLAPDDQYPCCRVGISLGGSGNSRPSMPSRIIGYSQAHRQQESSCTGQMLC